MIRRSRLLPTIAVVCAAVLVLAACGGRQQPAAAPGTADASSCQAGTGQLTIATGNATGVYYALGGGLASLISANTTLKATAAETGASVQNIQQLVAGEYDIAFSLADTAADAVRGQGAFTAPQQVQALARIYSNYTHVVVQRSSGITTMADFRGKRISTGSPKSGTEVIANRLLQAAGLNPETDVLPQRLELGKTVDAMKDGSIDGFVWSGGLPTGGVTDLFTSAGDRVEFLDISDLLPKMEEHGPRLGLRHAGRCRDDRGAEPPAGAQRLPRRRRVRGHPADVRQEGRPGEGAPGGEGARPEGRGRHRPGGAGAGLPDGAAAAERHLNAS